MKIYPKERAIPVSNLLFVSLWFGITTIIPWMSSYGPVDTAIWVIFWVFLLVGYVCVVYDIYNFLKWRSFGDVILHIDNYPKVGAKLDGYLVFPKAMKPDTTIDVVFRCEHRESKKIKLERSFRNLSNDKITSNDELVAEKNVSNKFVTEKNLSDEVFIHITLDVPIPWPKDSAKWYVRECHKNYHWTLVVSSKFEGDYLLRNYPIIIH